MCMQPLGGSLDTRSTKADALDGDLTELHLVAGEGAGLVAEDVVDLAQVLVQVGVPGLGVLVEGLVIPASTRPFGAASRRERSFWRSTCLPIQPVKVLLNDSGLTAANSN